MESIRENRKRNISRNGVHGGGRGRFDSNRVCSGWKYFSSSNNQNMWQELKCYPHGTGTDQQTEAFTKVKEYLILNIQSEFVNGSDISESIRKGVISYLIKEIPIKRILLEDEPSRAE